MPGLIGTTCVLICLIGVEVLVTKYIINRIGR